MLLTCPGCDKKMKVAETLAGKKVRCPDCKTAVAVPPPRTAAAPAPRKEAAAAEPPRPSAPAREAAPAPVSATLRCPACQAAAVQALPPNQFSRHPGYVCRQCKTVMRPLGSTVTYVAAIILGGFVVLLGIVLLFVALGATRFKKRALTGAVGLAGLGAVVAAWAVKQLRLPLPLGAPPRPSRAWIYVVIALALVLVFGAVAFFIMYQLHEM